MTRCIPYSLLFRFPTLESGMSLINFRLLNIVIKFVKRIYIYNFIFIQIISVCYVKYFRR